MSAAFSQNNLRAFQAVLNDLTESVEFFNRSLQLRPRLSEVLKWESIDAELKGVVTHYLRNKDVRVESHTAGIIVILSGAFERFVRTLIRDGVESLNEAATTFDLLPQKIRDRHVLVTGRALCTV